MTRGCVTVDLEEFTFWPLLHFIYGGYVFRFGGVYILIFFTGATLYIVCLLQVLLVGSGSRVEVEEEDLHCIRFEGRSALGVTLEHRGSIVVGARAVGDGLIGRGTFGTVHEHCAGVVEKRGENLDDERGVYFRFFSISGRDASVCGRYVRRGPSSGHSRDASGLYMRVDGSAVFCRHDRGDGRWHLGTYSNDKFCSLYRSSPYRSEHAPGCGSVYTSPSGERVTVGDGNGLTSLVSVSDRGVYISDGGVSVFQAVEFSKVLIRNKLTSPKLCFFHASRERLLCDFACGLLFLHEKLQLCHYDVSRMNCLVSAGGVGRVTDFGSCLNPREATDRWRYDTVGEYVTLDVRPPELYVDRSVRGKLHFNAMKVDVYSLGCVMLYAYNGRVVTENARTKKIAMTEQEAVSPVRLFLRDPTRPWTSHGKLVDLLGRMTSEDCNRRPTMAEVYRWSCEMSSSSSLCMSSVSALPVDDDGGAGSDTVLEGVSSHKECSPRGVHGSVSGCEDVIPSVGECDAGVSGVDVADGGALDVSSVTGVGVREAPTQGMIESVAAAADDGKLSVLSRMATFSCLDVDHKPRPIDFDATVDSLNQEFGAGCAIVGNGRRESQRGQTLRVGEAYAGVSVTFLSQAKHRLNFSNAADGARALQRILPHVVLRGLGCAPSSYQFLQQRLLQSQFHDADRVVNMARVRALGISLEGVQGSVSMKQEPAAIKRPRTRIIVKNNVKTRGHNVQFWSGDVVKNNERVLALQDLLSSCYDPLDDEKVFWTGGQQLAPDYEGQLSFVIPTPADGTADVFPRVDLEFVDVPSPLTDGVVPVGVCGVKDGSALFTKFLRTVTAVYDGESDALVQDATKHWDTILKCIEASVSAKALKRRSRKQQTYKPHYGRIADVFAVAWVCGRTRSRVTNVDCLVGSLGDGKPSRSKLCKAIYKLTKAGIVMHVFTEDARLLINQNLDVCLSSVDAGTLSERERNTIRKDALSRVDCLLKRGNEAHIIACACLYYAISKRLSRPTDTAGLCKMCMKLDANVQTVCDLFNVLDS